MFKANRVGTPILWNYETLAVDAAASPFDNNAMGATNPVGNVMNIIPLNNFAGRAIKWVGTQHIIPAGQHVNIIAMCVTPKPIGTATILGLEIAIQANIYGNGSNDICPIFGEFDAENPPEPTTLWEAITFLGYPLPIGEGERANNINAAPGMRTINLRTQLVNQRITLDFGAFTGIGIRINNSTAGNTSIDALELGIAVRQSNNQELQRYEDGLR